MERSIFCMLISTSLCYGAAGDVEYKQVCPQPEEAVTVLHHNMPYQMASERIEDKVFTCIIADPELPKRVPEDFAKQIVGNMPFIGSAPYSTIGIGTLKQFKLLMHSAYVRNLDTLDLAAGISSVHLAILIEQTKTSVRCVGSKDLTWKKISDSSCVIGLKNTSESCRRLLDEFENRDNVRMLTERGEVDVVSKLRMEALSTKQKAEYDLIIRCNPKKELEEAASCTQAFFTCNVQ